jgi:hypothetical protein
MEKAKEHSIYMNKRCVTEITFAPPQVLLDVEVNELKFL